MCATFKAQGDKTFITIQSIFESAEQLKDAIEVFKADVGFKQNMDKLEDYLLTIQKPVVVERTFNAPISLVWKALTDNNEMKQWYFNLPEFKPEVGFEFQFTGGKDENNPYLHLCKIIEVIPEKN